MKNTGIVRKIDRLGRIVIPKEVRNTLRIVDDDSLELLIDGENIILRKFSYIKNLEDISNILLESINIKNINILIYDSNNIISSIGIYKDKLKGSKPSDKLLSYLKVYSPSLYSDDIYITPSFNLNINYYIKPIVINSVIVGAVMLFSESKLDDSIILISDILGNFLGKYMTN